MDERRKRESELEDLLKAVENGDCEKVGQLVLANPKINLSKAFRGKEGGITPLIKACEKGDLKMTSFLVEEGASLKSCTLDGTTPLVAACESENFEIIKLLVEKGAAVEQKVPGGWTPLCIVCDCENDHFEIASLLIDNGAKVNCVTKGKFAVSPLYLASKNGHSKIVELLLENGAPFNIICHENYYRRSPLAVACLEGHTDVVSQLVKRGTLVGEDLILLACQNSHCDVISLLLDFIKKEELTTRPLCHATQADNIELARFLISKQFPVNGISLTHRGRSPLMIACERNKPELAKLLLQNGAKIKETTGPELHNNHNAFHRCCFSGSVECAQLLLERGADVNEVSSQGRTPLMMATYAQTAQIPGMLLFLLKNGAKIHETEPRTRNTALHHAASAGKLAAIKVLCEHGLDPKTKNSQGRIAAQLTYSPLIKKFLEEFELIDGSIKPAKRVGMGEEEDCEEGGVGRKKRKIQVEDVVQEESDDLK